MIRKIILFFSGATFLLLLFLSLKMAQGDSPELPSMLAFSATPRFENKITIFDQEVDLSRWDMHERYERELTSMCYTHNTTLLTIKRANRIFPIIVPILKEEGVPEDLKYLCCIESGLNTRALSPAKAAGLWQFMAATGREMGLQVDAEVDERYHIEKATRAACKYFKASYAMFGDWNAVAASYNGGQSGLSKRIDTQKQSSPFNLILPEETSRYMFRIMAMKEIMRDPYHYGFVLYSDQLYRPISTTAVTVTSSIVNIADWAIRHNTTYYQVKEFNPWIRDNKLTIRPGNQYQILLPNPKDMNYEGDFAVYDKNWIVDK